MNFRILLFLFIAAPAFGSPSSEEFIIGPLRHQSQPSVKQTQFIPKPNHQKSYLQEQQQPAAKLKQLGVGVASWYGPGFYGRLTANGETFQKGTLTAARRTLPFGTMVRVTN